MNSEAASPESGAEWLRSQLSSPQLTAVNAAQSPMPENRITPEEWRAMMEADAGNGAENINLTDRDRASLILDRVDYEQQLIAIRGLLTRNRSADHALRKERESIMETMVCA